MLIDTHTYLYDDAFDNDRHETVCRAINSGVDMMILPNIDIPSIEKMKALHNEFPENTRMAIGLHPTEVGDDWEDAIDVIANELSANNAEYVAVGEIGVDLYWEQIREQEQMMAFERQARMASDSSLPIIIHSRNALPQTLEVLRSLPSIPKCIFHSFGGNANDVRQIERTVPDCVFGINGVVTFKNSGLRDVLPTIGIDRILLETDSPYLTPVPYRGKRNESCYLTYIARTIADSLDIDIQKVAEITSATAKNIFRIN